MLKIGLLAFGLVAIGGKQLTPERVITNSRVKRIAEAIARAEGFGVKGAIPTLRNNPGNIRDNSKPGSPVGTYVSIKAGWEALYNQVSRMLAGNSLYPRGWTLAQVAKRYTGESRYMDWANNVARFLGVSTSIVFSEIP
jgi:hypothetical protein